jgi:hypothetical protein
MRRSLSIIAVLGVVIASAAIKADRAGAEPLLWSAPTLVDHQAPFGNPPILESVSCPSASLCVAVDHDGNVVTSTDPTGGAGTWTAVNIEATFLTHVTCPSTSLCVATDWVGNIWTSTDPTGGASAWTSAVVADSEHPEDLTGISCPTTSLCVAIDGNGDGLHLD